MKHFVILVIVLTFVSSCGNKEGESNPKPGPDVTSPAASPTNTPVVQPAKVYYLDKLEVTAKFKEPVKVENYGGTWMQWVFMEFINISFSSSPSSLYKVDAKHSQLDFSNSKFTFIKPSYGCSDGDISFSDIIDGPYQHVYWRSTQGWLIRTGDKQSCFDFLNGIKSGFEVQFIDVKFKDSEDRVGVVNFKVSP